MVHWNDEKLIKPVGSVPVQSIDGEIAWARQALEREMETISQCVDCSRAMNYDRGNVCDEAINNPIYYEANCSGKKAWWLHKFPFLSRRQRGRKKKNHFQLLLSQSFFSGLRQNIFDSNRLWRGALLFCCCCCWLFELDCRMEMLSRFNHNRFMCAACGMKNCSLR